MKKISVILIIVLASGILFAGCGAEKAPAAAPQPTAAPATEAPAAEVQTDAAPGTSLSAEMAYEGVSNYCRSAYDWSTAEENPGSMYVEMGEETEAEYKVIFRSYTGAFVYFYVDKASGMTRMTEYVPALSIEDEAGSINLYDYLGK